MLASCLLIIGFIKETGRCDIIVSFFHGKLQIVRDWILLCALVLGFETRQACKQQQVLRLSSVESRSKSGIVNIIELGLNPLVQSFRLAAC